MQVCVPSSSFSSVSGEMILSWIAGQTERQAGIATTAEVGKHQQRRLSLQYVCRQWCTQHGYFDFLKYGTGTESNALSGMPAIISCAGHTMYAVCYSAVLVDMLWQWDREFWVFATFIGNYVCPHVSHINNIIHSALILMIVSCVEKRKYDSMIQVSYIV